MIPKAKVEYETTFGVRQLTSENSLLHINGRRLFLRGTLECAIFPLTGHPPTDRAGWEKVFGTARQYGLNHIRFHSWCPPEAAFAVADSLGFYLQIELPLWSLQVGEDPKADQFLRDEAARMSREYGNHPSFCFWSMGNELEGRIAFLTDLMTTPPADRPDAICTPRPRTRFSRPTEAGPNPPTTTLLRSDQAGLGARAGRFQSAITGLHRRLLRFAGGHARTPRHARGGAVRRVSEPGRDQQVHRGAGTYQPDFHSERPANRRDCSRWPTIT